MLYDIQNPKIGNPLTSIPSSLPLSKYTPGYNDSLKLEADAYVFYLDKNKQNVCSYCNATGEIKVLFNIVKETDTVQNRYSKFEVRPKSGGGLYDTYRFLIRSEIDRQYNMCFIFAYNMQKKRFSDHVKQFSGIDCIFIGDQTDEAPPLVVLQEDMQTILIAEIKAKDEIGLPRGDLKLNSMVKALYPTPFRQGLAVLYICQNKIKFSNNRIEENSFDDFKILEGTRQYFRLSYDEVVFNIVWQAPVGGDEESVHGSLVTNKRICILDSKLKPLKNIKISSDFSYNFIFSSYWLGQTLLYTTEDHIYYCNIEGESQIIFTLDNPRSVICDALADRVSIATYDNEDNVVITTRKVHMLEPLLMGALSYAKSSEDIDLKLLKCILQNLDTEQVSKALIYKLMEKGLYNSAWFLLQNSECPQFSLEDKYRALQKLGKPNDLLTILFGQNKDIQNNKHDLSEAINKLAKGGPHILEMKILDKLYEDFSKQMDYKLALKCAEIKGDIQKAVKTLELVNKMNISKDLDLTKAKEKLSEEAGIQTRQLMDIIAFEKGQEVDTKQQAPINFSEGSRNPWDFDFTITEDIETDEKDTFAGEAAFDSDISSLNRVDLGFDKQAFGYQVNVTKYDDEKEPMPGVLNDNLEHWLGYNSLDIAAAATEPVNEMMIGEEKPEDQEDIEEALEPDDNYDSFEDEKHLVILWRFDQGGGAKVLDLSENKNNGHILRDKAKISIEEAAGIWKDGELEAREPLDFEDEWGKESPANWALTFTGSESLRTRGSKSLSKLKGHFTLEVWLKMEKFDSFTIFKRQAEDYNLKLTQPNLIEVSREHNVRNIVKFNLEKDIPLGEWVHLSIIYRQKQKDESSED